MAVNTAQVFVHAVRFGGGASEQAADHLKKRLPHSQYVLTCHDSETGKYHMGLYMQLPTDEAPYCIVLPAASPKLRLGMAADSGTFAGQGMSAHLSTIADDQDALRCWTLPGNSSQAYHERIEMTEFTGRVQRGRASRSSALVVSCADMPRPTKVP